MNVITLHPLARATAAVMLALPLVTLPGRTAAEDIDIYQGSATGGEPGVMFLLDNTSNWSAANQAWDAASSYQPCVSMTADALASCRALIEEIYYTGVTGKKRPWENGFAANKDNISLKQGQVQLRALKLVLNRLVCSGRPDALDVRIGLALIGKETARSNGDSKGIVNFAMRLLEGTAATAGSSCKAIIDRLDLIDSKIEDPAYKAPSDADYGAPFYELFKYFGGHTNPTGAAATPITAGSPVGPQGYGPQRFGKIDALDDPLAFTDVGKTTYSSPINADNACGGNFIVLVGNTYPNAEPNAGPARFGGLTTTPAWSPPVLPPVTSDTRRFADEWAYFLANTDVSSVDGVQRVFTYTINTYKNQPDADQGRLLRSMAQQGGIGSAGYVEVGGDLQKLVDAFSNILTSIAAVNSVFTAATLPVSTTTQGTFLNQVFVGMFRPDAMSTPRWVGNLKQYKLGLDSSTGEVMMVDADGNPAILRGTGFFSPLARSQWTTNSVFFTGMPSGTPPSVNDNPDGQIVEKGGVAQQLRIANHTNADGRKLYTLPASPTPGAALSATPFSSSNSAVTAAFSATDILWIRGEDTDLEKPGSYLAGNSVTQYGVRGPRVSIHGDVLHSRPVALNYGSGDVVVFYGANDGFLRAVGGRQSGTGAGQELWSFIAPEHYDPLLKRMRSNSPELHLPSSDAAGAEVPASGGRVKKDYGMDGPIGVFARYESGAVIEAIIYATMRRGGRAVYAFDVTDRAAPTLKWKISNGTSGFGSLGQTWSTPRPVNFPPSFSADPIIVMGGGLDPAEDSGDVSDPQIGNRVYVINGRTGALLKELETEYSVVGDVTVIDGNLDGKYDRGYVADVRGNLYRIDMPLDGTPAASNWTIKKIAVLGGRVYGTADAVVTKNFIAVLIGTGDREKPLKTSTSDHFFLVKDTKPGAAERPTALTKADLGRFASVDANGNLANINTNVADADGCYIELGINGEKVVNSPFTIAGATYFGTNRPTPPAPGVCTANLGEAKSYRFPLFCKGTPQSTTLVSGGLPPTPVGGLVAIDVNGEEVVVPFIIGAGTGGSPFEAERPNPVITPVRTRHFWRIENSNR